MSNAFCFFLDHMDSHDPFLSPPPPLSLSLSLSLSIYIYIYIYIYLQFFRFTLISGILGENTVSHSGSLRLFDFLSLSLYLSHPPPPPKKKKKKKTHTHTFTLVLSHLSFCLFLSATLSIILDREHVSPRQAAYQNPIHTTIFFIIIISIIFLCQHQFSIPSIVTIVE